MTALRPKKEDVEAMLYQALGEPVGLLLVTNDPPKARQLLYSSRRDIGDPALGRLQFRLVSMDGEDRIAIVKGEVLPAAPEHQPLPSGTASPNLGDLDL